VTLAPREELDGVRAQRSREREERRAQINAELQILNERYEQLQKELHSAVCFVTSPISLALSHSPIDRLRKMVVTLPEGCQTVYAIVIS
jgi:hypothetical protein